MSNDYKIQKTYNKHADSYDKENVMTERILLKERIVFSRLWGNILGVGGGTGNNLSHYHPSANVITLDFSP